MEESKAPPEKIKVVDRRRFTDDGEPRQDVSPPQEAPADVGTPVPDVANPEEPAGGPTKPVGSGRQAGEPGARPPGPAQAAGRGTATPGGFLELVAMLAHQAELLLLGAEGFPAQPTEARRLIDYLGALEEKTKGNLTSEEAQVLSSIIFQLRTLFVQSTR